MDFRAKEWKAIRIAGVSLALFALLIFSTVVVCDFDCQNPADDARCPYCHLSHQAPAEPEITLSAPREFPVTTCFDLSRSENFVQSPAGPDERIN